MTVTSKRVKTWVGRTVNVEVEGVGTLKATVEEGKYKHKIRIKGKGVNALWCPFAENITGTGSKKYTAALAKAGRSVVADMLQLDSDVEKRQADLDMASHNLYCYSANALMTKAKPGFEKEYNEAKNEVLRLSSNPPMTAEMHELHNAAEAEVLGEELAETVPTKKGGGVHYFGRRVNGQLQRYWPRFSDADFEETMGRLGWRLPVGWVVWHFDDGETIRESKRVQAVAKYPMASLGTQFPRREQVEAEMACLLAREGVTL